MNELKLINNSFLRVWYQLPMQTHLVGQKDIAWRIKDRSFVSAAVIC